MFEKRIVDSSVDPASFWSNATAGKTFFTGNKTGLNSIGHTEEPRVVDEDDFMKTNSEIVDRKDPDNQNYGDNEDDEDNPYYYGENGEYYGQGEIGDYEYDPEDDFGYDEDDEDDHDETDDNYDDEEGKGENFLIASRPSSGRRTPIDETNPLGLEAGVPLVESNDKQVEDR